MAFGTPPVAKSYFPGMSMENFSPVGATVCYKECIMKETTARSNAAEGEKMRSLALRPRRVLGETLPSLQSIDFAYSSSGWRRHPGNGRWVPPEGDQPDEQLRPSPEATAPWPPRAARVADMWRTSSWSDLKGRAAADMRNEQELIRMRCGATKKRAARYQQH
ncbi:unnamed protein product [Effrenium voratum]|nr:unnamed protein product [Effrenium voratum]